MSNHPNWRLPDVPVFTLESPDFTEGEQVPDWSRADGENRAPTLRWSGAPAGTKSFVVTLYDPDAPTGSGFWHWAAYDLPATTTELPSGAPLPQPPRSSRTRSASTRTWAPRRRPATARTATSSRSAP